MIIQTEPFDDQKAGTSGLRKRLTHFQQKNYLENFVQSIFDCIDIESNPSLILGGDGRLGNDEAAKTIVKMAVANGFKKVIVGQNARLSTPTVSHLIRKYKTLGGIILSASHNPAGENGDFGIKFNDRTGGSAPETLMKKIYETSCKIKEYKIDENDVPDISQCGVHKINDTEIEIVDSVKDYCALMKNIFDFSTIKELFDSGFTMRFDAMNAVGGIYAKELFDEEWIINAVPDERFNGKHPDPNPKHAKELFELAMSDNAPNLCVACDGDADRNLILGKKIYVTPSDSLAVLCANMDGVKGVARSFPTSRAVDRVAEKLNVPLYIVPTGWKYPSQLLEAGKISICGEESFGTGSDHVREKDGIWAILMWLSIIAKKKMSVEEIMKEHWTKFGKDIFHRHDYEGIEVEVAQKIMEETRTKTKEFSYKDLDGFVSENQGSWVDYEDGARIVVRISGTDTHKSTLRIYMEQPVDDINEQFNAPMMMERYQELTGLEKHIGRTEPDTII